MSEDKKGAIHNGLPDSENHNESLDNIVDYDISPSNLTRRLFDADRKPVTVEAPYEHKEYKKDPPAAEGKEASAEKNVNVNKKNGSVPEGKIPAAKTTGQAPKAHRPSAAKNDGKTAVRLSFDKTAGEVRRKRPVSREHMKNTPSGEHVATEGVHKKRPAVSGASVQTADKDSVNIRAKRSQAEGAAASESRRPGENQGRRLSEQKGEGVSRTHSAKSMTGGQNNIQPHSGKSELKKSSEGGHSQVSHNGRRIKQTAKENRAKAKRTRTRLADMSLGQRLLWGFKWIVRVALIVFFGAIFACVGAGLGLYIGIIRNAPALELLSVEPDAYTSFVYDKDGVQVDEYHGEENRVYVTLDQIPDDLQNAFVAIEDERFYSHNGIDLKGIARSVYQIFSNNDMQGGSTITQQLIKNNVTKVVHNTVETKIQEQYLAMKYESMLTEELGSKKAAKDYILELYLNTVNIGHGYYGVQVASKGYYNKDVSELTLAECAVIAGITNKPTAYSPRDNPENNKTRQTEILKKMEEQGYITHEQYETAVNEDVYSGISSSSEVQQEESSVIHTYFMDGLFDQVSQDLQDKYKISANQANYIIYNSGLQIYSTLDRNIQNILDQTFADNSLFPNAVYNFRVTYTVSVEDSATGKQEHSEYNQYVRDRDEADEYVANKRAEVESSLASGESIVADKSVITIEPQAAMVIEDYHTGYVKALIGGRGEKTVNRGFNRATNSARQPGSVFKILAAYAPGIDLGTLTAATPIEDSPFTVGNYSPSNWWGESYKGMENVRKGIQQSMNIVTVKAMDMVGVDNCYQYLQNFGFTTLENDNHLSTALGGITHGVTQLEVTAAYGTIGNGGIYKKPTLYTKVLDHDGNVLLDYENDFEEREVISPGAAYVLIDMMKDVLVYPGTGTAAAFKNTNMALCGKTGTTQNSKDLTFVGITPYYVSGIWLGYDDYDNTVKNMEGLSQSAHEVVWRTCMEKVHEGLEVKDFEMPDDVVQVNVCSYSGLKPNSGCGSHYEYFVRGTEPSEYCKGHYAKAYLDEKYIKSGYGYSSLDQGSNKSDSSSTSSDNSSNDDDEDENAAAVDSPSVGYGEEFTPSDEDVQEAYEAEFGDGNNTAAPAETDPGAAEAAPTPAAPEEAPASAPAEVAPAEEAAQ